MDGSLFTHGKSYCWYCLRQNRLGALWWIPSHQQPISNGGFTLVELLVVVVILGVLSAVGIPTYFAQTRAASINAANQAVLAAAKACAAAQVTGDTRSFNLGRGVIHNGSIPCGSLNQNWDFSSDQTLFTALTTQARARVASSTGSITLVTPAS
jgi:prepilin-type N-terminal cleavage/methylation domain-containing protein